jgi:SnoaL-like domain
VRPAQLSPRISSGLRSTEKEVVVMTIALDDRIAIHDVLALHGHLTDRGETSRFHEVFADDVVYDLSAVGGGVLAGLEGLIGGKQAATANDPRNPVAQHLTNIVLTPESSEAVRSISKSLGVRPDGTCVSVTYHDVLRRLPQGWRVAHRSVFTS